MGGLNRTILAGRLTADPVVRYTAKETAVTHFCLAINRAGKKDNAEFINCVAWDKLAKVCGEYLKKGRLVAVEGRLQIRKYESKKGEKKTATEVVVNNLQMLDSKFYNAASKAKEELVEV